MVGFWMSLAVRAVLATLLPIAFEWIGFFRFDSRTAFWGFTIGFGVGFALGPAIQFLVSIVMIRMLPRIGGVPYINPQAMGRTYLLLRKSWLLHVPIADMNGKMLLFNWSRSGVPASVRRRTALSFAVPPVIEFLLGCTLVLYSWSFRDGNQFIFNSAGIAGLYLMWFSIGHILPIRTSTFVSCSRQAARIWRGGAEFDRQRDRSLSFQIETLSSWRPAIVDPEIDRLHLDLMETGVGSPSAASATFAGIRGSYLTAIARRRWQQADGLALELEHVINSQQLPRISEQSAWPLVAFHSAYVRADMHRAQVLLKMIEAERRFRDTPLFLLTDGLIALVGGKTRLASRQLLSAERNWAHQPVISGVTELWLELIRPLIESLPIELRGNRSYLDQLVALADILADQPDAEFGPNCFVELRRSAAPSDRQTT